MRTYVGGSNVLRIHLLLMEMSQTSLEFQCVHVGHTLHTRPSSSSSGSSILWVCVGIGAEVLCTCPNPTSTESLFSVGWCSRFLPTLERGSEGVRAGWEPLALALEDGRCGRYGECNANANGLEFLRFSLRSLASVGGDRWHHSTVGSESYVHYTRDI